MAISPPLAAGGDKKHWWLTNRKIVEKYVKEARALIATNEQEDITVALNHLEAALALCPRFEEALELKARSLFYLRRFKDIADMLQEYIPSIKIESEESSLSSESSSQLSKERVKLLSSDKEDSSFKCFSVADLKKKVMAGLSMNTEKEGHWRYMVLGRACYHLGLLEDAMALLQTGKRLAAVSSRRESVYWSDDSFSFRIAVNNDTETSALLTKLTPVEDVNLGQLVGHIKVLLGRRTAAIAALDAGHYSEAIRHFSKILDGRRGTPQGFLAGCYVHRANAFRAAGRIAEAIADCNRALALDPICIPALSTRAGLLESIRCFQECLRDLEHLKLLYNTILRDRKLPGPAWRRHNILYRDVPGNVHRLTSKIQEFRQRVGAGETGNVDYYALIGLRRGCSRSELERAHLLLCLRHGPDKALNFIDRCEFLDYHDLDLVKDQARMSALLLHRMVQKAYSSVMITIMDEEAAEKHRQRIAAALQAEALKVAAQEQALQEKMNKSIVVNQNSNVKPPVDVHRNSLVEPSHEFVDKTKFPVKKKPTPIVPAPVEVHGNPILESSIYCNGNTNSPENKASAAAIAAAVEVCNSPLMNPSNYCRDITILPEKKTSTPTMATGAATPFQGGLCRDIAIVANMLSKASFTHTIPVKYEALSC